MHVALLAVAALAATANAAGVSLTVDSKTGAYSVGFGSSTFSSGPYEFTTGASSFAAPARRPAMACQMGWRRASRTDSRLLRRS